MERNIHDDITSINDRELYNLIIMRPGGENTMRIIDELLIRPKNANQLAKILNLDYKTITYHLNIICMHNYVIKEKFDNYYSYFPGDKLIKNLEEYILLKEILKNNNIR